MVPCSVDEADKYMDEGVVWGKRVCYMGYAPLLRGENKLFHGIRDQGPKRRINRVGTKEKGRIDNISKTNGRQCR